MRWWHSNSRSSRRSEHVVLDSLKGRELTRSANRNQELRIMMIPLKRSLFGLVCLLATSVASVSFAAQGAEPSANAPAGAVAPARQGGGRQGGARQGGAPAQDAAPALPPVPL